MSQRSDQIHGQVPTISGAETLGVFGDVVVALLARGVIVRRPAAVGIADRLDADERAVRRLRTLRDRYGAGPVLLRTPVRDFAIVLAPHHVHRVLEDTPDPFSPANLEKRAALRHFEPHVSLISEGADRVDRRHFNEQVLEMPRAVHSLAPSFVRVIREEAAELLDGVRSGAGRLTWERYVEGWTRTVRRIVLGDAARDDHALTDMLHDLRRRANLSYLAPRRPELRRRFQRQLQGHLRRREEGSLAAAVAAAPTTSRTRPADQVPQWLFAFDAAAWASYRTLALLGVHDEQRAWVHDELQGRDLRQPHDLQRLRACVLESIRLWPTTPAVLRDTTRETRWELGRLPEGAGVLVFAPFFHRDDTRLPEAHRFAPELWLDGRDVDDWPLIPFSGGPGECPARDLVLFTMSTMLATLLEGHELHLMDRDRIGEPGRLAMTLSPFHLDFEISPR